MKKRITGAVFGASAILELWIFASWIDIMLNNLNAAPIYKAWNFFEILF